MGGEGIPQSGSHRREGGDTCTCRGLREGNEDVGVHGGNVESDEGAGELVG